MERQSMLSIGYLFMREKNDSIPDKRKAIISQ